MQKVYSRINWENEPSTKTAINEDNLNKMDYALDKIDDRVVNLSGYEVRVAESEKNAKQSEINAKESEENSKQSELKAKQYMEQAFSGTPEGYETLVEQVNRMDIATSNEYTLPNSKVGGYRLTELVGATVQNGEPSPSTPIAIENTFDCVEMIQGAWAMSSGGIISGNTYICSKRTIPCKVGDVVNLICDDMEYYRLAYFNENGMITTGNTHNSGVSETISVDGVTHFAFTLVNNNGISPQTAGKVTLTVNGKYVGQIVENRIIEMVQRDATRIVSKDNTPCNSDDVIRITTKGVNNFVISFYDKNDEKVGETTVLSKTVANATAPSEATYFRLIMSTPSENATPENVGNVCLTINGIGEKVATFLLNEPLRATDRLFKDSDGLFKVERKKGEATKETVTTVNYLSDYGNRAYFKITPNNKKQDITRTAISNKAIYSSNISDNMFYENITNFVVVGTADDTLETMQAKYNGIVIQYELATPTIEVLDKESQIALNGLETFKDMTYIEVDSKIPPTSISGEYGTSQVGAYTLKCMNDNDTDRVERAKLKAQIEELQVALVALGSEV